MSARGDETRRKILEAATALFAQKSFSGVTMGDICKACGISRGGLYRHYASTEAIMIALVRQEQESALLALEKARSRQIPEPIVLKSFLRSRLQVLCDPSKCINNALSDFAANSESGKELLLERAKKSISILTEMISLSYGAKKLPCAEPETLAIHIICLLEGLSKHSALVGLTAQEQRSQLQLIESILSLEG